jgi:hypothetical protein
LCLTSKSQYFSKIYELISIDYSFTVVMTSENDQLTIYELLTSQLSMTSIKSLRTRTKIALGNLEIPKVRALVYLATKPQ